MKTTSAVTLSTLLVVACTAPATTAAHRYIGTATPATPGPLCIKSKAAAQIRGGSIILTPDEGTWILEGLVNPDGTVSADKTQQAANKQPWVTTFDGRWTAREINGTYTTPRCTFTISLNAG